MLSDAIQGKKKVGVSSLNAAEVRIRTSTCFVFSDSTVTKSCFDVVPEAKSIGME